MHKEAFMTQSNLVREQVSVCGVLVPGFSVFGGCVKAIAGNASVAEMYSPVMEWPEQAKMYLEPPDLIPLSCSGFPHRKTLKPGIVQRTVRR